MRTTQTPPPGARGFGPFDILERYEEEVDGPPPEIRLLIGQLMELGQGDPALRLRLGGRGHRRPGPADQFQTLLAHYFRVRFRGVDPSEALAD